MRGARPRTTRLRPWTVGLVCALGLAAGCNSRPSAPAGGSTSSKADKARKDAEALALSAVGGAADAQAKAVPEVAAAARRDRGFPFNVTIQTNKTQVTVQAPTAPATPSAPGAPLLPPLPSAPVATAAAPKAAPRPGPPIVIRERVVSTISTSEADADADALALACDLVARKLSELDPPVRYRPSIAEVKAEFVRKDSRTVRTPDAEERKRYTDAGVTGNFVYVEYDVEVAAEQVRELRSQERSWAALRVLGVLVAVALAGFLFLRADEWTKGYLTSWLAVAAVVLAGGAAAAFIFA